MLNDTIHLPGASVLISDIGPQPADNRSDPESTLVYVTTNVNTACCRGADNNNKTNATAGAVGEWYYPSGTQVLRPSSDIAMDVERVGFTHEVRLASEVSDSAPPLGVYTCQVSEPSTGFVCSASITIHQEKS